MTDRFSVAGGVISRGRFVFQNGGAHNRPVEGTGPDDRFLRLVVGVDVSQQRPVQQVCKPRDLPPAFPHPCGGYHDETPDVVLGHAVHDVPRTGGEGGLIAQAVAAQGDNRRVVAGDR